MVEQISGICRVTLRNGLPRDQLHISRRIRARNVAPPNICSLWFLFSLSLSLSLSLFLSLSLSLVPLGQFSPPALFRRCDAQSRACPLYRLPRVNYHHRSRGEINYGDFARAEVLEIRWMALRQDHRDETARPSRALISHARCRVSRFERREKREREASPRDIDLRITSGKYFLHASRSNEALRFVA